MLLAIGLRCAAKNMLKVTHKCQPSNRGTERLLLWYLPAWQWRSWHGSPVLIRPLIICLVIEARTGSFFRLRLIRAHMRTPAWMQHSGANLFCRISLRRRACAFVHCVALK